MTRVGILGCGFIGRQHAEELRRAGAMIQAVADPDPDKCEHFRKTFGVRETFADGVELIEQVEVDAICICWTSGVIRKSRAQRAGKIIGGF